MFLCKLAETRQIHERHLRSYHDQLGKDETRRKTGVGQGNHRPALFYMRDWLLTSFFGVQDREILEKGAMIPTKIQAVLCTS